MNSLPDFRHCHFSTVSKIVKYVLSVYSFNKETVSPYKLPVLLKIPRHHLEGLGKLYVADIDVWSRLLIIRCCG